MGIDTLLDICHEIHKFYTVDGQGLSLENLKLFSVYQSTDCYFEVWQ